MRTPLLLCLSAALPGLLTSCTQAGLPPHPSYVPLAGLDSFGSTAAPQDLSYQNSGNQPPGNQPPGNQSPELQDRSYQQRPADRYQDLEIGRSYSDTRTRLYLFRDDIKLDELDVDFDDDSSAQLRNLKRTRTGFRAEFGSVANGGFFQLFSEKMRAPALLTEQFTNYGAGGGVTGTPTVGRTRNVDFLVPYRFEANLAVGSESVAGFSQSLWYAEGTFELGFGARFLGVQASSGLMVNGFAGLFDSDDPANPAISGGADITGSNFGAYLEVLYKHPRVPLVARIRGIAGDLSGVLLSFGFAF